MGGGGNITQTHCSLVRRLPGKVVVGWGSHVLGLGSVRSQTEGWNLGNL